MAALTESLTFDLIQARVVAWARTQPAIRGAVVVGSRAHSTPATDEWSDLDLILFSTEPDAYAADGSWLARFGPVWLTQLEHTGRGEPEWYALYAGGLKADFVLHTIGPAVDCRIALSERISPRRAGDL